MMKILELTVPILSGYLRIAICKKTKRIRIKRLCDTRATLSITNEVIPLKS